MDLDHLKKPAFLIDRAKVRRNVERMAEKAGRSGVSLRPHVKTHQSAGVAAWLRDYDVRAITVSSVDMAAYFQRSGWSDILISVPVNIHQIPDIDELAAAASLDVIVESPAAARALVGGIRQPLDVWIEVDTGYHRTGVPVGETDTILDVAKALGASRYLRLRGLLCHDGQTYAASGPAEVLEIAEGSFRALSSAVAELETAGLQGLSLSVGDTPSCSLLDSFSRPVSEIRPGNFVFYDLTQAGVGACREEEIAAVVACPVIAKYPARGEIVIYGGGVHISKESLTPPEGGPCFGRITRLRGAEGFWPAPLEDAYVSSLSQEQGIVKAPEALCDSVEIGETIAVYPVHACLTANLHPAYCVPGEGWLPKFRL
ncbi:MAG: hypothetical protein H6P95_1532 [Candidatus Aminicenantes bacterium]|nr:hypothetical protein [Candidatus Aminicenantes bacterium]